MRIVFLLVCATIGAVAAHYGLPLADHNADLILVIITVFSVFAGFLIAIITVLGDPGLIPEGSWRIVETRRDNIQRRIIWHSYLFILYLITIALLFVGVLLAKLPAPLPNVPVPAAYHWKEWVQRAYLFFSVFSFLVSFALPWSLMKMQNARVDAELQKRRAAAGIKDNETTIP